MPLVRTHKGEFLNWEPTTSLICSKCREPLEISQPGLEHVNFTFDYAVPDPLELGKYWYLHKHCSSIEQALDVHWGMHDMPYVLGINSLEQKLYGSLQKYLKTRMPPGVYDLLYEQWLPAIRGRRIAHRHLSTSIAFICAHCRKPLSPQEYEVLHLVWHGSKGNSFHGPHVLVHDVCISLYKQQHSHVSNETLLRLFDINIHSYHDWLLPEISDPLLTFFKPKRPPVRLKFGKDIWIGNSNGLTLIESEKPKNKPVSRAIQPRERRGRPPQPPKKIEVVPTLPTPSQRKSWQALRFSILQRDGYRCLLCGASAREDPTVRLEVDHIIARSRGGSNDPDNLWTLCYDCNRGKGVQEL